MKTQDHEAHHRTCDAEFWADHEEINIVANVRELIRSHAIFTKEYFDASQNLIQSLENIIQDQETEIAHLSDGQIKPLADYLLSLGGPGRDESACEMAVRLLKDYANPSA